jgi:hypothetical protein
MSLEVFLGRPFATVLPVLKFLSWPSAHFQRPLTVRAAPTGPVVFYWTFRSLLPEAFSPSTLAGSDSLRFTPRLPPSVRAAFRVPSGPLSGLLLSNPLSPVSDSSVRGVPLFRALLPSRIRPPLGVRCSLAVYGSSTTSLRLQSFTLLEELVSPAPLFTAFREPLLS